MTPTLNSEYENYGLTSKTYDNTRIPLGLKIILGSFAQHPNITLKNQRLLDAGCGTASFLSEIADKFMNVVGLDANSGMLDQARDKFSDVSNVSLTEGRLPKLPFPADSFDAVMTNQVVHHLDKYPPYSNLNNFTAEAYRVLAPGGSLVIHTSSKEQVCNSYWFGWIIPEAKERMAKRYAPLTNVVSMLENKGFEDADVTVPLDAMYDLDVYLNPKGPFDPKWRACDSMFALATKEELEHGLKRLKDACDDGSIEDVMDSAEKWRLRSGQSTFISVRKP